MCDAPKMSSRIKTCLDQSLEALIMHKGEQLEICGTCWGKICNGRVTKTVEHEVPEPLFGCD